MKGFLALGYSWKREFLEHNPIQGHGLKFQLIFQIVFVLFSQNNKWTVQAVLLG